MKHIVFDRNDKEQVDLIARMGDDNATTSLEAQEAFAAFIGGVIGEVLMQAGSVGKIYTDLTFDEDDSPSFPVDLYYGTSEGHIPVWEQTYNGGVPTARVTGNREIKLTTYTLNSAVSIGKKYARRSRLDVVAGALERMANEVLIKQERNGWAVLLKMLAESVTGSQRHVIRSKADGIFQVQDLNDLMTLNARLNVSYANGTPVTVYSRGMTDAFVSPEIVGQIRAFAYNPMNVRGGFTSGGTEQTNSNIALPDSVREDIFRNAGLANMYGVNFHQLLEFGKQKKYNTLFDTFAGSTTYTRMDGTNGTTFDGSADEIIFGVDLGRKAALRPVATHGDAGGQFKVLVDNQFLNRSEEFGFFGKLEEGRFILDNRPFTGLLVG